MADKYALDYGKKPLYMAEAGNAWAENYTIAQAANNGDKLYLGIIPAGVEVDFVRMIYAATGTTSTVSLGYEPLEGSDPAAAGTAWASGVATGGGAGTSISAATPIRFDKPVKLVATVGAANFSGSPRIDVNVKGICIGIK